MLHFSNSSSGKLSRSFFVLAAQALLFAGLSATASGQRRPAQSPAAEATPVYREYRGVQIGMTMEETRKKLGDPKDKADGQDFFVFNDKESAQVVYDKTHKVVTVSVDFFNGAPGVPEPKAVVGADIAPKADGSLYLMVRYPKTGYWVSYNRTAGDSPMVSVTIQKID
jgi:hypothetical protein